MKQEHIDKIKSYYDKTGEFKLNDRYSGEQGAVYTKDGDKYHWLVLEQKGKSGLEVRQTDGQGRITARDAYESAKNTVKCTGVGRLKAEGKRMVSFSADEINLIYQFGENSKESTLANLKEIEPRITDAITKEIVGATILTFRFSDLQKFKNLTSRVPIFGNQEVKEIDFNSSVFRNTENQFISLNNLSKTISIKTYLHT